MRLDTREVLEAARTKWNFLDFRPGLVGGHCIGVDPYYLTFKAQALGHSPQTILSGRRINDGMGRWIGRKLVKALIDCDCHVRAARILVCGLTFKENVTDTRNSKVRDIIDELRDYHVEVSAWDPNVSDEDARAEFDVPLVSRDALRDFDGIIVAVAHREFKSLSPDDFRSMTRKNPAPFFDLKWVFDREPLEARGFRYWRL
jgi:UDP-N-acetyl-D-galactosamine dehydrogenase